MNDPSFHLFEMQVCFKGWGVVGKIASPPSTVLCIKCACLLYIWPLITNKKNVCKIKCSRLTGHKSIHCAGKSNDKQYFNMDPIQISICLRPLTNWPAAQGRDPWPRSIVFCLSTTGLHDCGKEMGGGGYSLLKSCWWKEIDITEEIFFTLFIVSLHYLLSIKGCSALELQLIYSLN